MWPFCRAIGWPEGIFYVRGVKEKFLLEDELLGSQSVLFLKRDVKQKFSSGGDL